MDFSRALDVLVICIPVFAAMGLGKLLERKGRLNDDHCGFINWLVYHFSLPALIFNEVARQHFSSFLDPALVLVPLVAIAAMILIGFILVRINRYKGGFAAAFVFGTFWANATYMGFPLCFNAFGGEGLAKAAIYNAFVMPAFVIAGYLQIAFYGSNGGADVRTKIKKAFFNPVVLAAFFGIVVALIGEQFRTAEGDLDLSAPILALASLVGSSLKLIGGMGLPLALLSIGASLRWQSATRNVGALCWVVGAKLILLPLIVLIGIRLFCPGAETISTGVAIILSATPCAVASYVVSCQLGVEKGFVSSMLVLSTGLSVLTIPLWMYLIKGFGG